MQVAVTVEQGRWRVTLDKFKTSEFVAPTTPRSSKADTPPPNLFCLSLPAQGESSQAVRLSACPTLGPRFESWRGHSPGRGFAPSGFLAGNLAQSTGFRLSATDQHTILSVLSCFCALLLNASRLLLILPAVQRTGGPARVSSQRLSPDPLSLWPDPSGRDPGNGSMMTARLSQ
jgi:hypothetical protein